MAYNNLGTRMRVLHRYLGFFLAGIMAVYAISGIVMIFRNTDFLKKERQVSRKVKPDAKPEELGKLLGIKEFKAISEDGAVIRFTEGEYRKATGEAEYTAKQLPFLLEKMTKMHKATSADPLYILNIFFGLSLLFFVISSCWMFTPKSSIFKKGLYFTAAGIVLVLLMLLR